MDLQSILDNTGLVTALKWIGTILVAGFIGQFGRKFAEHLIERAKIRRQHKKENKSSSGDLPASPKHDAIAPPEAAEVPQSEGPVPSGVEGPIMSEEMAKAKKKADKAAAKAEKKRLKAEKKKLKDS